MSRHFYFTGEYLDAENFMTGDYLERPGQKNERAPSFSDDPVAAAEAQRRADADLEVSSAGMSHQVSSLNQRKSTSHHAPTYLEVRR